MSNVLIVDDEKSIRITLSEFLRKENYQVDSAADTLEAYKMMESKKYDIVITDIIMPHESGIDMLTKIRKSSQTMQIIVMTGEPTVETAVKAVQYGASDYLAKPINKENLLKTVHKAAQIKNLHDEKFYLEEQNKCYKENLEVIITKKTRELQNAMQSIVSLVSSVVEIRDPYTAGHQRKVGNLSAAIAKKIELDENTINLIRIIGYIHDIGKIVIPAEILSKSGNLSCLEMQMIQNHPLYGYEMIKKVELPDLIADTIYQHHERIDGSGYPRALKLNEITKEANIIIVSDVVEAMMSHRPYRPALGIEAALDEIKQDTGKRYDNDVVTVCVELFEKDNYIIDDAEYRISFPL